MSSDSRYSNFIKRAYELSKTVTERFNLQSRAKPHGKHSNQLSTLLGLLE